MPDRVKETLFGVLGSYYGCPGALPAVHVADVFAGSGSIGLEALSRGAVSCCFFERERQALEALRKNIEVLGAADVSMVVKGDAWSSAVSGVEERRFDLVFLDPPYRESEDTSEDGHVRKYLARVAGPEDDRPLVVLHHSAQVVFEVKETEHWQVLDRRIIGTGCVTFFHDERSTP